MRLECRHSPFFNKKEHANAYKKKERCESLLNII
jgi:hypothetical protein